MQCNALEKNDSVTRQIMEDSADVTLNDSKWNSMIQAICYVESKNNEKVSNGGCAGILQISMICVKQANLIMQKKKKKKRYTSRDRYCKTKSIEIFNVIQDYFNPKHNIERAIRLWNGGNRYSNAKTQKYYSRVMRIMLIK